MKTTKKAPSVEVVQTEVPATKLVKTIKITIGGKAQELTVDEANALAKSIIEATGWKPADNIGDLMERIRSRSKFIPDDEWPPLPKLPRPYYGPPIRDPDYWRKIMCDAAQRDGRTITIC